MLARKVIYIIGAIILASCSAPSSETTSLEDRFAAIIKNDIQAKALKNTTAITVYSLNILKIDTITTSTLDSQLIIKVTDRFDICNAMADLYISMSQTGARIRALDRKMKKSVLPATTSSDIESDAYKAQQYKDSARYYHSLLDSLEKMNINNKFPDTLYQVRSFLKATEKNTNDSTNYFGIRYYYITKNNQVYYRSDLEPGNP